MHCFLHLVTPALPSRMQFLNVVLLRLLRVVIRRRVNTILDDLRMQGWYRQIVTDCGSNAKSAFRRDQVWDWMRCACHLLHNVVDAGFKNTTEEDSQDARAPCLNALAKAKAFVAHIHHSRKASERFNAKQRLVLDDVRHREAARGGPARQHAGALGAANDASDSEETLEAAELHPEVEGFDPQNVPRPKRVYRLVSQVDTRWNSRCYMIERCGVDMVMAHDWLAPNSACADFVLSM